MQLPSGEPEARPWRVIQLRDLVEQLLGVCGDTPGRPRMVAVDGRSAGGKSAFAARLAGQVTGAVVVHTDDIAWYHSFFDWTDLMIDQVLLPVRAGQPVNYRPSAWVERERPGAIGVPAGTPLLVVEGVGAARRELEPFFDALIWVQSDFAEAERRGLVRDIAEGTNGDAEQVTAFWHEWMAQELPFQAGQRPWERVDFVVAGTPTLGTGPDEVAVGVPPSPLTGRQRA